MKTAFPPNTKKRAFTYRFSKDLWQRINMYRKTRCREREEWIPLQGVLTELLTLALDHAGTPSTALIKAFNFTKSKGKEKNNIKPNPSNPKDIMESILTKLK